MNAQQLKNSILQEAIEGRLVPQDPNDEPASVLLERIREEKKRLVKEGKLKKKDLEEKPIQEDEIPFDIPDSWEWVRLGAMITYQNGYSYNSSETNKEKKGLPVIKSGNLMTLEVVIKPNNDYVENPTSKMLASKIAKGDMLMCLSSQSDNPEPLGKTAVYNEEGFALLNQRVLKFRPVNDIITSYLYYTINSFYFWYNVSHQGGGSAQANLKLNHVLDMLIPLPPLAEQKRIVAKIEELLPKVEEYGKAQDALDKLNAELPERLKKSILQEAISGRLVPQDPNDEPASILLDKIRAEKAKLVKEGKLKKKDLEETPIQEDEIPFDIPDSWERVKLSFITSLTDGVKKEGNYVCLDAKYLRGKSTGDILPKGKFVCKNDNIILVDGENSGEVFTVPCDGYMGSTFKQLWVSSSICLRYVLYFILLYKDILRNSKKGAAIPHLNKDIFNNLIIGIPPLAEQKRIVAKIEQLMAEIDKLK